MELESKRILSDPPCHSSSKEAAKGEGSGVRAADPGYTWQWHACARVYHVHSSLYHIPTWFGLSLPGTWMLAIDSSLVASCWLKKEKNRTLISFRTWRGWRLIRIYHLSLSLSHASDRRRVALSHRHINPLSRSASAPPSSHGRVLVRIADYSNTMGCRVR